MGLISAKAPCAQGDILLKVEHSLFPNTPTETNRNRSQDTERDACTQPNTLSCYPVSVWFVFSKHFAPSLMHANPLTLAVCRSQCRNQGGAARVVKWVEGGSLGQTLMSCSDARPKKKKPSWKRTRPLILKEKQLAASCRGGTQKCLRRTPRQPQQWGVITAHQLALFQTL